jgi:hypothetical protein
VEIEVIQGALKPFYREEALQRNSALFTTDHQQELAVINYRNFAKCF